MLDLYFTIKSMKPRKLKPLVRRAINRTREIIVKTSAVLILTGLVCYYRVPGFLGTDSQAADQLNQSEISAHAWNNYEQSQPHLPLYAHRGLSSNYTENTPEAFAQAFLNGCPQVELDVWLSADGVLVVSHDQNVVRVYGQDKNIGASSSADLNSYRAANGQPLISLQKIFDIFGNSLTYLVEFKGGTEVAEAFEKLMENNPDLIPNVQIQDFELDTLLAVDAKYPNMYKMLLMADTANLDKALQTEALNGVCIDYEKVTPEVIAKVHEAGKKIVCYTVNDEKAAERLWNLGVDAVISDSPATVLAKYNSYVAGAAK